ncbi:MAG: flavin reductase [Eubacteriales bacterium]|jgi:flavin reductase (DIM6/NTAB) family NADH-FMN oxidoreductase RutF/rubredoxin
MNDNVMRNLTYGLFVCTAKDGDRDNGCIINTALQVASAPNTIAISLNKTDFTHDMIMKTGEFNVSIISENAKFDVFRRFGYQSGRDADKMAGIEFRRAANGITYLTTPDVNGYLSGKVKQTVDLGSHTLFIADVTDGEVLSGTASATYAYYFANIKPKPEAPKADEAPKKGWICTICGYIYEGEVLPPDFICPVCKHPASDFRKL